MKTIIKILFQCIAACFILAGCEKMNDLHQKYLDGGEIIYLGVVDSLKTHPGYERMGLSWEIGSDPRITRTVVYWNEGKDSLEVPVNRTQPGPMPLEVIIPLPEGFYQFELVTKDNEGHRSLGTEISGNVYGEIASSLYAVRKVTGFNIYTENDAEIFWGALDSRSVKTALRYKESDGQTIERTVPISETQTLFSDFQRENNLFDVTVISCFLPYRNAIDTIKLEAPLSFNATVEPLNFVLLSKTGWVATSNGQTTESANPITNTIDGNNNTYWLSTTANDPRPLYLQVDMKKVCRVKSIKVTERTYVRKVVISASLTGTDYTEIGSLSFPAGTRMDATLDLPEYIITRYLRISVTETTDPNGGGGFYEIDVTGL